VIDQHPVDGDRLAAARRAKEDFEALAIRVEGAFLPSRPKARPSP
jgi:hypothetical protein